MKKTSRRLRLTKDTLVQLQESRLADAHGGDPMPNTSTNCPPADPPKRTAFSCYTRCGCTIIS
jgi:hypothetical protein